MTVPGIVESKLGDESVAARITLSGGDEVFVTPSRTLVYRGDGLLSDESVEVFEHGADRLSVSEGRRKSKIVYEDAVDGSREFAVPSSRLTEVLQPVLAGTLRVRGVTDDDERIAQAYRFSELTLVITNERLLKHVGEAVWDAEYESFHFGDVTGIDYEEGSVATSIVMDVDGRTQRIKTPNDEFAAVREQLDSALFSYHNVSSARELAEKTAEDEDEEADDTERVDATDAVVSMGEGIDPLSTGGSAADGEDVLEDPATEQREQGEAEAGSGQATAPQRSEAPVDAGDADTAESDDTEIDDTAESDVTETDDAAEQAGDAETDESSADADPAVDEEGGDGSAEDPEEEATEDEGDDEADADEAEEPPVDPDEADETVISEWESPPDESGSFGGGFEPAGGDETDSVAEELADLRETVERQTELLERQQETMEQLVVALQEREASREESD